MQSTLYSSEIAEPYAVALMSVATAQGQTTAFGGETRSLLQLLENSEELRNFIKNPTIAEANKKAVLNQILGSEVNVYFNNFLMLLVDKRRISLLAQICEQYLTQLRKLNNIVLAEVTSVKELSEAQLQAVTEKVKAISGATEVELKSIIDSEILGGIIIKIGSQVVDASLRGQLRRIRYSLSGLN